MTSRTPEGGRRASTPGDGDAEVAASPFALPSRTFWPRLHADILVVIFVGGSLGGLARYLATRTWPSRATQFPWATLGVNLVGAFVLGVVVSTAAHVAASRYLRPLLGTGFCGGLTTFSSVVVGVAELLAHHRAATATLYLSATICLALIAAWAGLLTGRKLTARHRTTNTQPQSAEERTPG